jgi:lauroyl/myristoyl acyltransferase
VIDTQARDLWRNIGRTFAEFSVLPRIVREQRVRFGQEGLLRDLVTDPRPLIACFVHLGNWEAMGAALVLHPAVARHRKMTAVVALPQNPAHAMIAKRQHDWLSIQMLHAGPGIWRSALNALRQPNAVLWVAIDNSQGGDVGAPRLGVPRETNGNLSKIVRLAAATGAVVVPMYCERLQGAHFAAHILTPHEVPRGRLDETALRHEIDRLDLVFDPLVRQHVTQWYMAVEFSAVRADMTPKGSH